MTSRPGMITRQTAQGQVGDYCRANRVDFDTIWALFQELFGDHTEYRQTDVSGFLDKVESLEV